VARRRRSATGVVEAGQEGADGRDSRGRGEAAGREWGGAVGGSIWEDVGLG
jgi:hypothetical protein